MPTRDELLQLVQDLNAALGEAALKETQVEKTFNMVWPELEERLDFSKIPPDGPTDTTKREPDDLLAEILDTVRNTGQENTQLLTWLVRETRSISAMLPATTSTPFSYVIGSGGSGSFKNQWELSKLHPVPEITYIPESPHSGADTSTTGGETPVVPPASQPKSRKDE
jgi:hypothetical protein